MSAITIKRIAWNLALVLILCLALSPVPAAADSSVMVVDGVEYSCTATHSGDGWSYIYASGMGYLRLNNYIGGAIFLPCSASVEYEGQNMISAPEGYCALECEGETLILGSIYPDADLTLVGSAGFSAVYGRSVSLWGWGQLHAFGGSGASAVWGGTAVLATMEQMVLSGGGQMAITTDLGGVIRVSGAHKYYAGMSADSAVESDFYGGEFYLRAEAARAVITFDASGGTVNGEASYTESYIVTTSGTNLTVYAPERENYTFRGWNTRPDGSGSEPPPRLFTGGDITYYALWDRDPTVIPIPDEMLGQENALIYAAIYYGSGQLWDVLFTDGALSALTLPDLPEEGMTYTLYCVDSASYIPLTDPEKGTL